MQPDKPSKPSPAKLKKAFLQDLTKAWTSFRSSHAHETAYAFALYGMEGGLLPQLYSVVMTEESLTQVAQRYVDEGHHDTLDEARRSLRYSVADSPHFANHQEMLPAVDALIEPCGELDETDGYEMLAKAAMAAFQELDAQGLFGTGQARERLLLIIITEDTEKDWSEPSAKKINPPSVYQRFIDQTRVEGEYASCGSFAFTADGASLFACITRKAPGGKPGNGEFAREICAFERKNTSLAKRWTIPDSARDVVCTPDGRTVVALDAKRIDKVCHMRLTRLHPDSGKLLNETSFLGEPCSLAIAGDASRIAAVSHDSTVRVLDSDFQLLHTLKPDSKPKSALFLSAGELLIATDKAVLKMDPAHGELSEWIPARAFHLSTDLARRLLCVSRWFFVTGVKRETDAFGVKLFNLQTRELVREFLIPGHQCVHGVISPDGQMIAAEAHLIGTPRNFLVLFDVATGNEIARRKSPSLYQLSFLANSRTLAIAFSGTVTGEPISFWHVP